MMIRAPLSELNVGDSVYQIKQGDVPIYHPNLAILYSEALLNGNYNFLTTEQKRLLERYIYNYDVNDIALKRLDEFLGAITMNL